jgi:hypothetical protein
MTRQVRSWAIAALAVFASVPATLQGETIIWGTPSLINAAQPTQVVNTGNVYSAAYNNPFTVNSVLFNTAPSTVNYESGGIYGLAIPDADPSYSAILYGFYFIGGGGTATTTLSGLTIGQRYQLQVFTPSTYLGNFDTKLLSGANTVVMGNTGIAPTYVSGFFTADATTQTFDWTANTGSTHGVLAAVNVVAVPNAVPEIDPATGGSALTLVAGVLAMIEQRRRRATLVA